MKRFRRILDGTKTRASMEETASIFCERDGHRVLGVGVGVFLVILFFYLGLLSTAIGWTFRKA